MNKHTKRITAIIATVAATLTLGGCTAPYLNNGEDESGTLTSEQFNGTDVPAPSEIEEPAEEPAEETAARPTAPEVVVPEIRTVSYLKVTADSVNIRSGAGADYSSRGTAQKSTIYAFDGSGGSWYKTSYKNKTGYLSSKYCEVCRMTASENERIEAVIAEGAKLLGTVYVYGAIRYHDGNGNLNGNFTTSEFDCSSLMQYIFRRGAGVNLQVTTRTQIFQGTTVSRAQLKRGDLMFFTNASRKNNKGVERVGHVALYLGDNWILHTASDFAKIEQISSARWDYFIQGQRIL